MDRVVRRVRDGRVGLSVDRHGPVGVHHQLPVGEGAGDLVGPGPADIVTFDPSAAAPEPVTVAVSPFRAYRFAEYVWDSIRSLQAGSTSPAPASVIRIVSFFIMDFP
jgi:hypothetical protein